MLNFAKTISTAGLHASAITSHDQFQRTVREQCFINLSEGAFSSGQIIASASGYAVTTMCTVRGAHRSQLAQTVQNVGVVVCWKITKLTSGIPRPSVNRRYMLFQLAGCGETPVDWCLGSRWATLSSTTAHMSHALHRTSRAARSRYLSASESGVFVRWQGLSLWGRPGYHGNQTCLQTAEAHIQVRPYDITTQAVGKWRGSGSGC
jgi:hypothetical protein